MERIDRRINTAADLGERRAVSLEEALDALFSINEPLETIAHRINSEKDDSAVLIVARMDKGDDSSARLTALLGNGVNAASALAETMIADPQFKTVIRAACFAVDQYEQQTNKNYDN